MLQNWRANVDIQIIADLQACARYMTKYAAKGESLFWSCTENTSNKSNSHQVLFSRSPDKAHNYSEFQDAVHLFYHKKSVGEYNLLNSTPL